MRVLMIAPEPVFRPRGTPFSVRDRCRALSELGHQVDLLFPHDDALKKMLFLAYLDIQKKWTMPVANWAFIISQLSIIFKDRLKLNF